MLLPVGDITVIDRIFTQLEADARVNDVYISTNERSAADFDDNLADSESSKLQLSIRETFEEDEKFGVIGVLAQLVERECLTDDLLVVAGDKILSFGIAGFIHTFEQSQNSLIAAYDVGSTRKASQYGVIELDNNRVVDFQEKPESPASSLVGWLTNRHN